LNETASGELRKENGQWCREAEEREEGALVHVDEDKAILVLVDAEREEAVVFILETLNLVREAGRLRKLAVETVAAGEGSVRTWYKSV
jgi:hypothetical protein